MVAADIYQGETYNASRATAGWDSPGYTPGAGASWQNCTIGGSPHNLTKHPWNQPSVISTHAPLPQIEITGAASPVDFWLAAPNSWVFDFGVNRAGVLVEPHPLATDNLLEKTGGVPHHCSLGMAACYLLFMLTTALLMTSSAVTTLTIPASVATSLGVGATWTQKASEALLCDKPCGINHYPAVGANEIITYISDPALNSVAARATSPMSAPAATLVHGAGDDEAGAAAINFTPRFTQFGFRYIQLNFTAGASSSAKWVGPTNETVTMQFINTAGKWHFTKADLRRVLDVEICLHAYAALHCTRRSGGPVVTMMVCPSQCA